MHKRGGTGSGPGLVYRRRVRGRDRGEALHCADKFIVDDVELARYFDEIGKDRVTADGRPDPEFPGGMPEIYSTIGDIVAKKKRGRESDGERIIATPLGMAICDVALAHLIYQATLDRNTGRTLNLM